MVKKCMNGAEFKLPPTLAFSKILYIENNMIQYRPYPPTSTNHLNTIYKYYMENTVPISVRTSSIAASSSLNSPYRYLYIYSVYSI